MAKEMLELESTNLELTLTAYHYLAILFYDDSEKSDQLLHMWEETATKLPEEFPQNSEIAKIYAKNYELDELITAYNIQVPSIQIVRRGDLNSYRGSLTSDDLVSYLSKDSKPPIERISSLKALKSFIKSSNETIVFGLFSESDISEDLETGYSVDNWGQFSAVAEALRGVARFILITSPEVQKKFGATSSDIPSVYLVSKDSEGFMKYHGEIIEMSLSEWILRNCSPTMSELTVATSEGELYASHFFSSRKLKFILFLTPFMVENTSALLYWQEIAEMFTEEAIFAYLTQSGVADVVEYFEVDFSKDLPMVAAHMPIGDYKYKSKPVSFDDKTDMLSFVKGVISGKIGKVLKSEILPKVQKGPVIKAVGANILDIVSTPEKDVLLAVYSPQSVHSKRLLPTYDLLGKAVASESRILIVKIDGQANDLPASWAIKGYPVLLWFPAKDKPYDSDSIPSPRPYWDAGVSLPELTTFVQRESSFDLKSLKIATIEQIGSLMSEEENIRLKYEEEERKERRNEGRVVYDLEMLDWLVGEVAFDGKRWHLGVGIVLLTSWLGMALYILFESTDKKK